MGSRDEIEPKMPVVQRGREVETINALAVAAKAMQMPELPVHEQQKIVKAEAAAIVSIDPKSALYQFPMGGTTIEGLASGLATSIAWKLGRPTGAFVERETDDHYYITAFILNPRTGASLTRQFRQRKCMPGGKFVGDHWQGPKGKIEKQRILDIMLANGMSRATRNVIVNAEKFLCLYALQCAKAALSGERTEQAKTGGGNPTVEDWKALDAQAIKCGVTPSKIAVFLGVPKSKATWAQYNSVQDTLNAVESSELSAAAAFMPEPGENGGAK